MAALLAMAFLGAAHVLSRWLFNYPFLGTPEILEFLNVGLVSTAILYTHNEKSHLSVDLLFLALPKKFKVMIDVCTNLVSTALCFLISWGSFELAEDMRQNAEVSYTLEIRYFPFIYGIALCFAIWGLLFLKDLYRAAKEN